MFKKNINIKKILALVLAVISVFSSIPVTVFAAPASDIPDEMLDNVYLDALAYTGYDVQGLKDNGQIFKKYGSMVADSILSNISYDTGFANEGTETVADSSTVSGKAPNLARFEKYGLCCASYCSYVYFNYLPNIVGMDTSDYIRPTNLKSSGAWSTAAQKWVDSGLAREIKFKQSSDGKTFTTDEEIPIGSLIVFTASGTVSHVGLYAGKYNGKNFITHVGNSRGPEIITLEGLSKNGAAELVSSVIVPEIIEENGVIEVYKKDTNGKALSGAVFVATHKETGTQYKIGPTNSKGYAVSQERLPYGTYTVKETVFPTNYQASGKSEWTVTVNSSNKGTVTINAVNEQIPGKVQIIKTSEDGKVDGISFHITGNGVDKTVRTENGGKIIVSNLKPGTYTITETVEDKYEPQEIRTVTVVSGQTSTITFNNTLKRGDLKVTKASEDGLNEGIKFHLYGISHSGLKVDEYAITDKNGIAIFNDVLIGNNYTLEEVDTDSKYVIPESQSANIEWNKVTEKSFHNVLKKFTVTVTKTDVEKGSEQGDATLTGAVYGIYDGDDLIDKYTTDANGKFTTKEYVCGDNWTLREITASEGYLLDETVHKIGAESKNYTVERNTLSMSVTEQAIKGNIAIIKHSNDGSTQIEHPEVGAEFQVYLKSAGSYNEAKETERDTLVCDKNGFAQTKDFPYGTYTVHQTKGAEGREFMPDFDAIINTDGQTYRYLINNANFESYVKVIKKDAETGKTVPYAGAGFKIYDPDGKLVTMTYTYPTPTTIDTFYTDANGSLVTPERLPYGKGYTLVEVQAPCGYVIDRNPVSFDITADTAKEDGGITVVVIEVENKPIRGTIMGKKIDEDGFAIAGAVFGLFNESETEFTEETAIMISTSNEIGVFGFENVSYGEWIVREIETPLSFKLNPTVYKVKVMEDGEIIELVVENKFILGSVKVTKVDEDNPETKLSGAIFELYVDVDGNKEFNPEIDILIGELKEDEVGVYIMNDLRYNGYFIHEKSAPDGYIKDDGYHYFEITEDGMLIELEISNEKIPEPETPNPNIPNTDVPWRLGFWIGMTAIAFGGLVAYVIITVKKKDEE